MRDALVRIPDIEAHVALLLEQIERDALQLRRAPVVELQQHLVVGHVPIGVVEAHGLGQPPEQFDIGNAFARRGDRRLVEHHVEMPPRHHEVVLLALHRRRQQNVRVARRIGNEQLADDHEQVLALQPLNDLGLLRRLRHRIGIVDEQRLDRRVERHLAAQRGAELELVDDARARLDEVRPADAVEARREFPDRHLRGAAAHVPPGADQGRKAGDRADRLAAAAASFDRHALANGGWLGRRIFARQLLDVGHRDAGDLGNAFGRIVRGARLQLLEAERVFLDVIVIDQTPRR